MLHVGDLRPSRELARADLLTNFGRESGSGSSISCKVLISSVDYKYNNSIYIKLEATHIYIDIDLELSSYVLLSTVQNFTKSDEYMISLCCVRNCYRGMIIARLRIKRDGARANPERFCPSVAGSDPVFLRCALWCEFSSDEMRSEPEGGGSERDHQLPLQLLRLHLMIPAELVYSLALQT